MIRIALVAGLALILSVASVTMWRGRSDDRSVSIAATPSSAVKPVGPSIEVKVFDARGNLVGPVNAEKLVLSDDEWRQRLTREQFFVLRAKDTEAPFCGTLLDNKLEGVYACVGCRLPLFASNAKFNSGTGWPSFFRPIARENVLEVADASHGHVRVEILCARCDGHLGHVFDDGPPPTGLRFCLNSESLTFTPQDRLADLADPLASEGVLSPTAGERDAAHVEAMGEHP